MLFGDIEHRDFVKPIITNQRAPFPLHVTETRDTEKPKTNPPRSPIFNYSLTRGVGRYPPEKFKSRSLVKSPSPTCKSTLQFIPRTRRADGERVTRSLGGCERRESSRQFANYREFCRASPGTKNTKGIRAEFHADHSPTDGTNRVRERERGES